MATLTKKKTNVVVDRKTLYVDPTYKYIWHGSRVGGKGRKPAEFFATMSKSERRKVRKALRAGGFSCISGR